ncbi:hypothetical protein [Ornithinimicrobium cryptoxanthini]|uniref:Uncharacterized protein n=1 Tax=Ornithinimicrobium cryptoxanthini TaxID=2934161 RepID=A0ABY4YHS8_9MICO|nr:hypothetical protein [Ornithinimicrobium cryptoxanthini]USQ76345.1 hypothetical protein NF557_17440 [Ornithinimicrobium cryptoxanthini]
MVGSRPGSDLPDDELDPTGVRAMLANLPDPGPMPEELVARISQSLLLEQERRAEPSRETSSSPVISWDAERRRRRPGRTVLWLGGAAAVAMVATASVNQLFDDGTDSGVSAQAPARDASEAGGDAGAPAPAAEDRESADDAGGADSPAEGGLRPEAEDGVASPQSEADAAGGAEVLALSGTLSLSSTDVAAQVQEWLTAEPAPGAVSWTTAQVNDCVDRQDLDTSRAGQVVVANAMWSAEPAMVLVARTDVGGTAWVLTPDCDAVLTGPVTLD